MTWTSRPTCSSPWRRGVPKGHPAMVWVHGGVHGNWGETMWPFVREAVERGYVIICPEYRGSTGYGEEHHRAIDYGGYEVDDAITAYDWLVQNLPHVDPDRVGIMGWSHGGYITVHSVTREGHPFQAGAAIVPVTNLIFRLSWKGPGYQRSFSTQQRIQGLPFEQQGALQGAVTLLPRGRPEDPPAGARGHQRRGCGFRGGRDAGLQAQGHAPGHHRDPDLHRPGAVGLAAWATPSAAGWIGRRWSGWTRRPRSTRGIGPGPSSIGISGPTRRCPR